jgi:integrase
MASIYKRDNKDGTTVWRAVVRIKGYPTVCYHCDRKQEAVDWAQDVERKIKQGQFKFDQFRARHTFTELLDRYVGSGSLEHHKSADDTLRHLNYWKERFKSYALVHLTPEFLATERKLLLETPSNKGQPRSPSTVNRYCAALSSVLTYASRELRWIDENPCFNLVKLKEPSGRDRILSEEEISRLLSSCRQSKSPYLYGIVLISLTTGARQGEILDLEWRHVDFNNKLAYLKETKNGRPRSISLADPVLEELKRLYEIRNPSKRLVFASKTAFGQIDIKKPGKKH